MLYDKNEYYLRLSAMSRNMELQLDVLRKRTSVLLNHVKMAENVWTAGVLTHVLAPMDMDRRTVLKVNSFEKYVINAHQESIPLGLHFLYTQMQNRFGTSVTKTAI